MTPLAFIGGLGTQELIIILVIVLVLFGAKKLPELARGMGKSIKEFKKASSEVEEEFKQAMDAPPAPPTATAQPPAAPQQPPQSTTTPPTDSKPTA